MSSMTPTPDTLEALGDRLDCATHHGGVLRFGIHPTGDSYVIASSEANVRLLCDVYNARHEVAACLRAHAAIAREEGR